MADSHLRTATFPHIAHQKAGALEVPIVHLGMIRYGPEMSNILSLTVYSVHWCTI